MMRMHMEQHVERRVCQVNEIVLKIRRDLEQAARLPENRKGAGLVTGAVRSVSQANYAGLKKLSKEEILDLCDALLAAGGWAKGVIAFDWAYRLRRQYAPQDFERFERWLETYVDGWSPCDDLCTHALGEHLRRFPENTPRLFTWAASPNRWLRRGAAVALIPSVKKGENTTAALHVADLLLVDPDDLVQKGYGWMLKEMSRSEPELVFDYVMQHKTVMPRTALRYAIEKLSSDRRAEAMAR
jgi:3-methyladenine DNA glycosylase AlkD